MPRPKSLKARRTAPAKKVATKAPEETVELTGEIQQIEPMQENEPVIVRPAVKKKRVPVALRDPMSLDVELDPNFHYRIIRGKPRRVRTYLNAGYEIVENGIIGEPNIAKPSRMGSAVTSTSGDNEDTMYLMRIPNEFWEADQLLKKERVDAIEEQLKRKPKQDGLEGEIKGI